MASSAGSNSDYHAFARLKAVMAPALAVDRLFSSILAGKTKRLLNTLLRRDGVCLLGEMEAIVR